jgi:MFS family permease
MTGMSFGGIVNIAVFLRPLAGEFGWTRGELSLAYSAVTLATGLGGILMGHYSDRLPTRRLALIGSLVPGLAFIGLSRLSSLHELYLYHVLMGFLGFGSIIIPVSNLLTYWFVANRGFALGLAGTGAALGQALMPFLCNLLIQWLGWRGAYFAMGLMYPAVLIPLALLLRQPPGAGSRLSQAAVGSGDREVVYALPRERLVMILCVAVLFCCITMAVPAVHVATLGADMGLSPNAAAGLLTVLMLFGLVGRVASGKIADSMGGLGSYIAFSLAQTVLVGWFPYFTSSAGLYLWAAVYGLGYSGVMTAFQVYAREIAPLRHTGMTFGLVAFAGWIGMGLGGWQGGLFYDLLGNYRQAFANAAFSGVANLLMLALLYYYTVYKPPLLSSEMA